MRGYLLCVAACTVSVLLPVCRGQVGNIQDLRAAESPFFSRSEPESGKTKICVPELDNISTRSVNLTFLRERLIKLLQKKTTTAIASNGTATQPDYAQARDAGCTYILKVEIRDLRLETARPGITIGPPRTPDVAEPESLNRRYTARVDYALTKMGENEASVTSVANGESDSELQAVAGAMDFVASRVIAELKKK